MKEGESDHRELRQSVVILLPFQAVRLLVSSATVKGWEKGTLPRKASPSDLSLPPSLPH